MKKHVTIFAFSLLASSALQANTTKMDIPSEEIEKVKVCFEVDRHENKETWNEVVNNYRDVLETVNDTDKQELVEQLTNEIKKTYDIEDIHGSISIELNGSDNNNQ